jgi:hypothetical protein
MRGHNDPLRNVPALAIAPPARCYYRGETRLGTICGELANWLRPGRDWFTCAYFCDAHRGPSDLPIPAEHAIRRVRVNAAMLFAAACQNATIAHTEALARLEAAVQHAGGLLDVQDVTSTFGKSSPPPRPWKGNGAPIDPR